MNIPRNIIFDGQSPMAVLGSPPPIPAPQTEAIIDLNWVNYFLLLYLIILIGQYVCIFMSVPFDDVINRPSISILSSFYDGIMVCILWYGSIWLSNYLNSSRYAAVSSHWVLWSLVSNVCSI